MGKNRIIRSLGRKLSALQTAPEGKPLPAPEILKPPALTPEEVKKYVQASPLDISSPMGAAGAWQHRREEFALQVLSASNEDEALAAAKVALSAVQQSVLSPQRDSLLVQQTRVLFACASSALPLLAAQGEPDVTCEIQTAPAPQGGMPGALFLLSAAATLLLLVLSCLKLSVLSTALCAVSLLCQLLSCAFHLYRRRRTPSPLPVRVRASARLDPRRALNAMDRLMEALDKRLEELDALYAQQSAPGSDAPDAVLLDLLSELLELESLEGGEDTGAAARRYLTQHGVRVVGYSEAARAAFDIQPARTGARTVRPALYEGDRLLRRGVAAVAKEA